MSCSQIGSVSTACNDAGYYADQTECQNSVGLGVCSSTTVQTTNKNLVCWKSGSASNQMGNTNTGTGTGTNTNCSGQSPPWTMGAWAPSTCAVGVTQRTRTVTCNYSCPCDGVQPSTTETCSPNMYQSKHYETECTAAGGTLEWIEGNRICKMSGSACQSGWTQLKYNNTPYTVTTAGSAQEHTDFNGGRNTVYTGHHDSFTPAKMIESLVYCSARNLLGCKTWSTVYATVVNSACY